jgi:SMODS domain-containing protein
MTVAEAFQIFKSELELPDRKQKQAAAAQQEIRERISAHLYVPDSFLSGSYARYTKIYPLNDIDLMLVRNKERVELSKDESGVQATQAIDQVVEAVGKAYPNRATTKKQSRSVNVQIQGLEFGFDLVPAWLRKPDGYWIPDTDSGSWLPTDPEAHERLMTEANEHSAGKLKPMIKMAKHWSRNNYDLLRSFHLELICAHIVSKEDLPNYPVGVATVLLHLPSYVGRQIMDPVYGVSRVDKPLASDEQSKLVLRINSDAQNAVDALKLEAAGRHSEAIEKWKCIFLSGFPK